MRITNVRDLGLLMRDRRQQLGWDQQRLATEIGVSRQWVVQFEKGKARAAVDLVVRALRALGLNLDVRAQEAAHLPPSAAEIETPPIDLDQVVDKARGRKP